MAGWGNMTARLGLLCAMGAALLASCRGAAPGERLEPTPVAASRLPDSDLGLGREAFFEEVLYPEESVRTWRFDDYTGGSYHVDPTEVVATLPEFSRRHGKELDGLIIAGPFPILWEYRIIAFFLEGDEVVVNQVVMPHARITLKSSGRISLQEYHEYFAELTAAESMQAGAEARGTNLLLAYRLRSGQRADREGFLGEDAPGSALPIINQILNRTAPTYLHGQAAAE